MNWGDLKAATKTAIWREETPDDVVDRFARQALREIMYDRDWTWLTQIKTSAGVDEATITPPPDFGAVQSLSLVYQDWRYELAHVPLTQLRLGWGPSETGEPLYYAFENDKLYIAPVPDKPYDFELIYRVSDTPDTDTWSNPATTLIPQVVIDLAAAKIMLSHYQDREASKNFHTAFENALGKEADADDRRQRDHLTGLVRPDNALWGRAFPNTYWSYR